MWKMIEIVLEPTPLPPPPVCIRICVRIWRLNVWIYMLSKDVELTIHAFHNDIFVFGILSVKWIPSYSSWMWILIENVLEPIPPPCRFVKNVCVRIWSLNVWYLVSNDVEWNILYRDSMIFLISLTWINIPSYSSWILGTSRYANCWYSWYTWLEVADILVKESTGYFKKEPSMLLDLVNLARY